MNALPVADPMTPAGALVRSTRAFVVALLAALVLLGLLWELWLAPTGSRALALKVLPLCLPPVIVQATLEVGGNILAESALSFLGLGVQPPVASWGNMLMSALDVLKTDPPSALLPGCCILLTVLCVQLAGDGLRDLLDPKAKR